MIWLVNEISGVVSDIATLEIQEAASKPPCVPPFRGGLYKDMPSRLNCTPAIEMLHPSDHSQTAGANDVKRINNGAGAATYGGAIIEARNAMHARVPAGGTISC